MRNHPMRTHPEADACRIKVIRIRVGPHEGVPQYEGAASQSETGMRIREIERTSVGFFEMRTHSSVHATLDALSMKPMKAMVQFHRESKAMTSFHRTWRSLFMGGVQHCHCTVKNEVRGVAGNPDF